ncbi:hypothetical protein GOARA_012_00760 [Gordonia araii NBRC 100433]|uniref:DUF1254 domain-containing protein n=1 Tax=Gordonia araii NBRC 100433 TaxID=1073574 RepID=G7GY51_9ACTN|nr:DUF1254 domain-containing protein [Gordonia araii]NNG98135.1 DUF1254 domain-containing protein [Gordonia araii NBRC 100433]GAB08526.1 hypothetical protein GOARA_012_00760 [Gordonia araii NBRC 100433]
MNNSRLLTLAVVSVAVVAAAGCGSKDGAKAPSVVSTSAVPANATAANHVDPEQVQGMVKNAYTYGFPMVDVYRIMHSYFVDKDSGQYLGPWNAVHSIDRVYTPADTAVQTPNSDTPYSWIGADLRAEPLVLSLPKVEEGRYFSVSFIDGYTYDYEMLGSRTTGNGGGKYLLVGPNWQGEKPAGVVKVIRANTELSLVLFRTQLFNPGDIANVQKIQSGYHVEPLSKFEGKPSPPAARQIDFMRPLTPDQEKSSLDFFKLLNFTLQFAPPLSNDVADREQMAQLGLTGDGAWDPGQLDEPTKAAFAAGVKDAWTALDGFVKGDLATGRVSSGDLFGAPEQLAGNYLYRMAGAVVGILGLPGAEALYFPLKVDATGAPLSGTNGARYTLTFPAGQLPPVNAFWSVTMYKMPESLLVENPINRYLINSPMLDQLTKNPDGSATLHIQKTSPGSELESNWLPAPDGPFDMVLRLYWPKSEVTGGSWTAPKVVKQ